MVEDTKIEIELLERELRRLEATRIGRRLLEVQRALIAKRGLVGSDACAVQYEGLGIVAAARRLLREQQKPMATPEIARLLLSRGVTTRSPKYVATVYSTLLNSRDFVRIGEKRHGRWALAEWEDQQRAA